MADPYLDSTTETTGMQIFVYVTRQHWHRNVAAAVRLGPFYEVHSNTYRPLQYFPLQMELVLLKHSIKC